MYEQIASNKRKTALIVFGAFVLLAAVGFAIGALYGQGAGPIGLAIALGVAAVLSFSSWRYGDRLVLASARAKPVTPEEEPRLHNIVEGLAIAAGVPKPAVYVIPEQALNAFATGRDPAHSSLAVTRGLLDATNRVELEGVIGHEMAHVVDRDILLGTIVATLIGAVVLISEFMLRAWFWGGIGGRRSSNDGGGGAGAGILALVGIVLMILAPIAGQLIRMSMSRNREYLADAQGALLTRYPPGLASALRKIAGSPTAMHAANNATAHLWLSTPSRFRGEKTGPMERLFETHPPIAERIRRLEEM